jgi:hypothetical protein
MKIRMQLECKWQDAWIGAYWQQDWGVGWKSVHMWVCVVPFFPLHVIVLWESKQEYPSCDTCGRVLGEIRECIDCDAHVCEHCFSGANDFDDDWMCPECACK